jgi:benzylsuccinate CoA-transferase BbsF subunit
LNRDLTGTPGGPLKAIRVLDFTWVGAGALATKLLADLGADVIKVESRARPDNLRLAPPYRPGAENLEGSGYFASRNSSKRSFALDMRKPEARGIALRLASQCSVVTSNFRPGVMARWGLSYDQVRAVNPSVIYLTMPMQGEDGPHAAYTGFGSTISALAGLVELSGLPDHQGVGTGTHYPDHVPNPGHALVALLSAILYRNRTGIGQQVEVSQLESTVNVVGPAILEASGGAPPHVRTGNRVQDAAPHGVFPTRGVDRWCAISCRTEQAWRELATALDRPEWLADPRFGSLTARKEHEDELERLVSEATVQCGREELVELLRRRGVAAAAVNSSKDILEDPNLVARGYWQRLEHPVIGEMTVARPPFVMHPVGAPVAAAAGTPVVVGAAGASTDERMAKAPTFAALPAMPSRGPAGGELVLRRPPLLGEHTRDVARELLHLSEDEIGELERAGVLA